MIQYKPLNVKVCNSQLKKLKSRAKNGTKETLNLSSNVVSDSNDETNFRHKLSLTDTQVLRPVKAFANGSSANIKLSKTQLSKMIKIGGFFSIFDIGTTLKEKMVVK